MDRAAWLTRAAVLSLVAAMLHAFVTGEHFDEWWGYGVFFLVAAMGQGLFGAIPFLTRMMEGESVLMRWSPARLRAYLWAGIVGNALIVAMYVVTRTVGIPFFGPAAGEVETVGAIDIVSKVVEVTLIVHCMVLLRGAGARKAR